MAIGQPGQEQFRDVILEMRNRHIAAGMFPLIESLRPELTENDEFINRGGFDNTTRDHLLRHLVHCDAWRRRITYNPEAADLKTLMLAASDVDTNLDIGSMPFAGDSIQQTSDGLFILPWDFAGDNPNLPLNSKLKLQSANAVLLLGAIDNCIVAWTHLNSRSRSRFITKEDSFRIYERYQEIAAYLEAFGGDENFVDHAQIRPTEWPRGPATAPNRNTEAGTPPVPPT